MFQGIASVVFGPEDKSIDTVFAGVVSLAGASISVERLVIVPISAALIACLFAYIQWTRSGRAMRAVAQDADAAALQGVNPVMISGLAFAIGCALAAGAGGLVAPVFLLNPFMGGTAVMKAFVIICLGGMGSVLGAVLGGLILGLVDSFCTTVFGGPVAQIAAFVILIAVLLFRPQGLLGRESR